MHSAEQAEEADVPGLGELPWPQASAGVMLPGSRLVPCKSQVWGQALLAGTNDCLLHGFLETPRPACCSMKWGGASLLRTHTSCCSARAHIEQQGGL